MVTRPAVLERRFRLALVIGISGLSAFAVPAGATEGLAAPRFGGIDAILADEDSVTVFWNAAENTDGAGAPCEYLLYVAGGTRDQDFSSPRMTTDSGATHAQLTDLPPGRPVYVVVRARNSAGVTDENEKEWCATPHPVRHVDPQSTAEERDGLTPATAFASLREAAQRSIDQPGVNLYLRATEFEERLFIFDGMTLFGGFEPGVAPEDWARSAERTTFRATTDSDLTMVSPGERPCGLHRIVLDGAGVGARGLVADDCELHLGDVLVRGFTRNGIDLRSDRDGKTRIAGSIRDSLVEDIEGEGIVVEGIADLAISDTTIVRCSQEGFEVEPCTASRETESRIVLERCRISDNGDLGLDIEFADLEEELSDGASIRFTLRDSIVERNADHGLSLDLPESGRLVLVVKIQNNRFSGNGGAGALIESEAVAEYLVQHDVFSGNGPPGGLAISGSAARPIVHVHQCRFEGENGPAIHVEHDARVLVRHSEFVGNAGGSVVAPSAMVDLEGCLLSGHVAPPDAHRVAWSLVDAGEHPADGSAGPGVRVAPADEAGAESRNDAGNPLLTDPDGSRANLGPEGGPLGGGVGPGRFVDRPELRALVSVRRKSLPDGRDAVSLRFDGDAPPRPPIRLLSGGEPVDHAEVVVEGATVTVSWNRFAEEAAVEIRPWDGPGPVQPWFLEFAVPPGRD